MIMFEINARIRDEMARQKITITDLARLSGLNRSSISRYVSDTIEPKQNAIGAIAKALHVSPAWLLGFDVKRERDEAVLDISRLTETNKARVIAYFEALLETQDGANDGDPKME